MKNFETHVGSLPNIPALKGNSEVSISWARMKEHEKSKKNKPSLIFMCQLVLEISQFKVRNLVIFSPHKDAAIVLILSLVLA